MSPRPLIPNRRKRILDAAEALVLERGFDAMSMQALAERVGIAKGATYREFASKDAVLDALLRRATERTMTAAAGLLADDPHPPLSRAYRAAATVLLDEPLLCAAFLDDAGVLGSAVDRVSDGRYRERHLAVQEWVRDLKARGALVPDIDPDGLALALSSATLGLLTAAKTLGPLTRGELLAALTALEAMVRGLETS